MKKIIAILMLCGLTITMAGCGNMALGVGNYTYKKVHVDTHNFSRCFTIEKWYDNSTGIEVATKEVGNLFLAEGTYFLVEDECPFCVHEEGE